MQSAAMVGVAPNCRRSFRLGGDKKCWGLDFGSSPHPQKCSLTRLQGSNERKASIPEGVGWSLRSASSKTRTFGDEGYHLWLAEGDEWLLRSASSKTNTFGGEGYDEWLLGSTSLKTRTFG